MDVFYSYHYYYNSSCHLLIQTKTSFGKNSSNKYWQFMLSNSIIPSRYKFSDAFAFSYCECMFWILLWILYWWKNWKKNNQKMVNEFRILVAEIFNRLCSTSITCCNNQPNIPKKQFDWVLYRLSANLCCLHLDWIHSN